MRSQDISASAKTRGSREEISAFWHYGEIASLALAAASRCWQTDADLPGCERGSSVFSTGVLGVTDWSPARNLRVTTITAHQRRQFHAAIYLAHITFGISQRRAGLSFARDRTTVRYACRKIEDAREEPQFDLAMDFLTLALQTHADAYRLKTAIGPNRH